MMEFWSPIPGYENYRVSSCGVVKRQGRALKQHVTKLGYPLVRLYRNNVGRTFAVHTLVLIAFEGPPPEGYECRHLDGNRLNNRWDNLIWGTHADNCQDTVRHGRSTKGEKNPRAKLTLADVKKIRRLRQRRGHSYRVLAELFSVSQWTIGRIIRRDERGGWGDET